MATTAASISSTARGRARTALVASADGSFRQRLNHILSGLRWQVREANGGAQAWGEALNSAPHAMVVDSWLPDLDIGEFLNEFRASFPDVDVVTTGGSSPHESAPGPHRKEILYALQRMQDTDTAVWNTAPDLHDPAPVQHRQVPSSTTRSADSQVLQPAHDASDHRAPSSLRPSAPAAKPHGTIPSSERIPELIGISQRMLEISRRIRLVAPRTTPVLIEGPTGSGKELVADALHRLSARNRKPFVAINCAAIPETLLEAELFGHTRGAFTGAVQGRVGRIEAADGGTLFLDEIGEMPLALQAKLLRFVECGELQRVGDNETVKVDVRILAATHQPLAQHTQSGGFRSDLYYRLAVFLIRTPALVDHLDDLPLLVDHFLERMGREAPVKRIDATAMEKLRAHTWPGNVRELEHVLERAAILAGDEPVLTEHEIDFGCEID
jgi:DNA-binding NtrC family response regulator